MLIQRNKLPQPVLPARPTTANRRGWYWPWLACWAVALLALSLVWSIAYPAHSELNFTLEQLSGNALDGPEVSGFYTPETDQTSNRFVWTAPQASIWVDISSRNPVKLVMEMRSAALSGGPADPVKLLVNGREIAQLNTAPGKLEFQPVEAVFTTAEFGSSRLQITLQTTLYNPPKDRRKLGTMVKSISLQSEVWIGQASRLHKVLLAGLVVFWLSVMTGWLARVTRQKWAGPLAGLSGAAGVGLMVLAALTLAPIQFWLVDRNPYTVQSISLFFLAAVFGVWTLTTPLAILGGRTVYRQAYRQIARPVRVISPEKIIAVPALTGLRMIAAGLVFLFHVQVKGTAPLPRWLSSLSHTGNIGVPLFFTLSGFVICYNYYGRMLSSPLRQTWAFGVARFARIYPMYLFVLVLSVLLVGFEGNPARADLFSALQYLFVTQSWNPDRHLLDLYVYNGQVWTLTVEVFLYLCFPLLVWLLLQHCRHLWHLIAVGGLVYGLALLGPTWFVVTNRLSDNNGIPYWIDHSPLIHLADFIVGCVVARLYVRLTVRPVSRGENRLGGVALLLSSAAIILLMIYDAQPWLEPYRYDLLFLPFFAVVIFTLARYRTFGSRWLSTRPMVLLGEASYSFYLLHQFFLINRFGAVEVFSIYIYAPLVFVLCCIVSVAAYRYIETPARRFIHRTFL